MLKLKIDIHGKCNMQKYVFTPTTAISFGQINRIKYAFFKRLSMYR